MRRDRVANKRLIYMTTQSDKPLVLDVTVGDGKYTVRQDSGGKLYALRYRDTEIWRDLTGDGLVCALAHEVERLRMILDAIEDANINEFGGVSDTAIAKIILAARQGEYPTT